MKILLPTLLLIVVAQILHALPDVQSPSFEQTADVPTGWSYLIGSGAYVATCNYFGTVPANGFRQIVLNGNQTLAGRLLQQSLTSVAGRTYNFEFDYSSIVSGRRHYHGHASVYGWTRQHELYGWSAGQCERGATALHSTQMQLVTL